MINKHGWVALIFFFRIYNTKGGLVHFMDCFFAYISENLMHSISNCKRPFKKYAITTQSTEYG